MGCAASSDKAERRRRGRGQEHCEADASTPGLLAAGQGPAAASWMRRGRAKVAPEPKDQHEPASDPAMPGSPSFRYYCQTKAAAVDALVAEAEAVDRAGSVRITETSQAAVSKTKELKVEDTSKNKIVEVSKPKQVTKWLRFRGLAIVAAWYNLFSRHRSKASSAASAKSYPPGPAPAARSHT